MSMGAAERRQPRLVKPCGSAAFGVLLVDRLSLVVRPPAPLTVKEDVRTADGSFGPARGGSSGVLSPHTCKQRAAPRGAAIDDQKPGSPNLNVYQIGRLTLYLGC
jgi:hypothetical protein